MAEERSAFFLINRGLHNSPKRYVVVLKAPRVRQPVTYLTDFLHAAKNELTI
ncbi:hypothetical protein EC036_32780 [Enterobacter cloacae]|nr:hypothetical protein EC036_32780 [Enterobacter cloacae]